MFFISKGNIFYFYSREEWALVKVSSCSGGLKSQWMPFDMSPVITDSKDSATMPWITDWRLNLRFQASVISVLYDALPGSYDRFMTVLRKLHRSRANSWSRKLVTNNLPNAQTRLFQTSTFYGMMERLPPMLQSFLHNIVNNRNELSFVFEVNKKLLGLQWICLNGRLQSVSRMG